MSERQARYARQRRWEVQTAHDQWDRVTCAICDFPGVQADAAPGESPTGSTQYVTNGSTYVWTAADDALSTLDLEVVPTPNEGVSCPFCGGERFLDGRQGSGHRVP